MLEPHINTLDQDLKKIHRLILIIFTQSGLVKMNFKVNGGGNNRGYQDQTVL